jgi:AraC-like DNA-binding protein
MALSLHNLAFSWSEAPLTSRAACHLLLLRWTHQIEMPRTPAHSHAFWQIEIVTEGEIQVRGIHQTFRLSPGDAILLPPRVQHQFIYEDEQAKFMSFSLAVEGEIHAKALHYLKKSAFLSHLTSTIQSLIPDSSFPDDRVRLTIGGLLAALLSYVYTSPAHNEFSHLGPLVQRTVDFVRARNGGLVTVQDVADHLGYTANYTSTQFHQLTRESLKNFLDRQRTEKAKDLLRYTNLQVKQIAKQLEFSDVFAFSRHFRRVAGVSPRQFRRQEQQ